MTEHIQGLIARQAVLEVVHQLFNRTDERDWEGVKACFAPEVVFDMTSLVGGDPVTTTAQSIVEGWAEGLSDVRSLHHQVGNTTVHIDGDQASVFCHGLAFHHVTTALDETVKMFVGTYDLHLGKTDGVWRIDRFRFNLRFTQSSATLG
jgi:hypothetical protein